MIRWIPLLALALLLPVAAFVGMAESGGNGSEALATTPHRINILVVGDSIAAGYGLPSEQSFPSVLQALLVQSGREASVINAGVSGDTTEDGLARLPSYFPPDGGIRPDIVIVELGANDGLQGKDPTGVEANLDAMLSRIRQEGCQILLVGARPLRNKNLDYSAAFAAMYPRLAARHGATLYPYLGIGLYGRPELIQPDGAHPNAQGAQVIARNIYPLVVKLLDSIRK